MISVVIPLFDKAATIVRAIESVRAQTRADWELIVVDDGSRDGGERLAAGIADPRVRLVRQPNQGVAAARNRGAALARHPLVAFLDADDWWHATHLENLAALAARFPDAALYASAYRVVGEGGAVRGIRLRDVAAPDGLYLIDDYFADALDYEHPVHISGTAVAKAWFDRAGGFPAGVHAGEDIVFVARLACLGTLAYSRRATADYSAPALAGGRAARLVRRPQSPDRVAAELGALRATAPRHAVQLARYLASWHRMRAVSYLELDERRAAAAELWRAMRLSGPARKDLECAGLLALPAVPRRIALLQARRWRRRTSPRTEPT